MIRCEKYAHLGDVGSSDFNWDEYESGWNGISLKKNKKIKTSGGDKCYSHAVYAQSLYDKYTGSHTEVVKDLKRGSTVAIQDFRVVDDNTIMATVCGGATNVIIDLNKEGKFFNQLTYNNQPLTKSIFVEGTRTSPEFKDSLLSMNLYVKVGSDTEKGSIWDGSVERLAQELKEQIKLNEKAYYATILSTNGGGFNVEIMGMINAFMLGSQAASNRITDYESMVGKTLEVMVDSWNPKNGFTVSRKKYLNKIRPHMLKPFEQTLADAPETTYVGKITGASQYGVFVELNEFITGMLHKTLVSDELRDMMRKNEVVAGEEITVYVHKIENGRVILSDVPLAERDVVIKKREAEDEAEKSEHIAQMKSANADYRGGNNKFNKRSGN